MRGQLAFAALALFLVTAAASTAAEAPSLTVVDALATEPDTGTRAAVFRVRLSTAATETVTVEYATSDDSAAAPGDYAAVSGTLTFAPGETEKQVAVSVAGDRLDEPHETFRLDLSNAQGATLGDARGIGTILDNDPAVALSVDDVRASEGAGSATFTVALSAESGKVVTVSYTTADGTAAAAGDYAAGAGTLVFMPGQRAKSVAVRLENDDLVEPDETFALRLRDPVNATLADPEGTGTIADDDAAAPPPPGEDPPPPLPGEDPPPPPPAEDPPAEDPPAEDPPTEGDPPAEESPPAPAPAENAAPDCGAVAPSTATLWSPNHKFRPVALGGATDPDGDALRYEVSGVTQDEPLGKAPDAKRGAAPHELLLRAERLGKGDGRVYRIAYTVWDDHENTCSGQALVTVPHDRRHTQAVDSGSVFDSFGV